MEPLAGAGQGAAEVASDVVRQKLAAGRRAVRVDTATQVVFHLNEGGGVLRRARGLRLANRRGRG